MKTQIHWQPVSTPPDSDMNVLIHLSDGEVWTGFLDGDTWRFVTGDRVEVQVLHWADFPEPPSAN